MNPQIPLQGDFLYLPHPTSAWHVAEPFLRLLPHRGWRRNNARHHAI